MSRSAAALPLLVLMLGAPAPAAAGGPATVVRGRERAAYRVTHPLDVSFLQPYENFGFRQEVVRVSEREAIVEVEVRADPSESASAAPAASPERVPEGIGPEIAELAAREAAGVPGDWTASARLLALVGRSVEHEEDPAAPYDAASVWRRRKGSCVGRANLALALLRADGFGARAARGLRFSGRPGETLAVGPELLHRWVEVWIPDRGWVFSDPAVTLHHVSARSLWIAPGSSEGPAVDAALAGAQVTLLRIDEGLEAVDVAPEVPGDGLRLRPASAQRSAAALLGRAAPGSAVRLAGPGGARESRADAAGRFAFLGLAAGLYRLDGPDGSAGLLLAPRELRELGGGLPGGG